MSIYLFIFIVYFHFIIVCNWLLQPITITASVAITVIVYSVNQVVFFSIIIVLFFFLFLISLFLPPVSVYHPKMLIAIVLFRLSTFILLGIWMNRAVRYKLKMSIFCILHNTQFVCEAKKEEKNNKIKYEYFCKINKVYFTYILIELGMGVTYLCSYLWLF